MPRVHFLQLYLELEGRVCKQCVQHWHGLEHTREIMRERTGTAGGGVATIIMSHARVLLSTATYALDYCANITKYHAWKCSCSGF